MTAGAGVASGQPVEVRQRLSALLAKARLPLVTAPVGAVVAIVGSYLYWTVDTLIGTSGLPLSGDLVNFGFGGVRLYSLILAVAALAGGVAAVMRPGLRAQPNLRALVRLGVGITGIPLVFVFLLVYFEHLALASVGPGPWVTLAGGLVVWLATRSPSGAPQVLAAPVPHAFPALEGPVGSIVTVLAAELIGFAILLKGVAISDPGEFLGFFVAVSAATAGAAALGILRSVSAAMQRRVLLSAVVLVVLLVVFPFTQGTENTYWIRIAAQAGVFVVAALGLNIVVGSAGLLDLGYVAFVGIGAYIAALTGSALIAVFRLPHVPFIIVVLIVAPVVAAIFGVLLGAPTLRLRGDYLAIVTLGFGEIVRITLNNADKYTGGPNGISNIPSPALAGKTFDGFEAGGVSFNGNTLYFYLTLLMIGLVLFVNRRVGASRIGRAWVAIREDEVAASAMGINTTLLKLLAFGSGAFFAGMAGSVYAHFGKQVSPDSYVFQISVLILAMVVLGGLGNPAGVVLGAVLLTFLPEKLRDFADIRFLVFGLALMLIMRFRPEGLLPSTQRRSELRAGPGIAQAESQQLFDLRET